MIIELINSMLHRSIASDFYLLALAFHALYRLLVYKATRRPVHALDWGTVCTRPPLISYAVLKAVHEQQAVLCRGLPAILSIAYLVHHLILARLAAALWIALYHLCETSVTSRHGEYPLMQTAWAMVLPPQMAAAAAFGIAVNFIFCTGLAKIRIGGVLGWCAPDTMRLYLSLYGASSSRPPAMPWLNRWLVQRDWALSAISASTMAIECILVPALMCLSPSAHWWGAAAICTMHLGIALAMSLEVRMLCHAFRFPTLPTRLCLYGSKPDLSGFSPCFRSACCSSPRCRAT